MTDIKETICEVGRRLYDKNLLVACDGNISYRVSDREIWVTPTGVSKGFMTPDMLALLDIDGNVLNENVPSSEVKMHLNIYKKRPDIRAIVHAHPPFSTAFAAAGRALDKKYLTELVMTLGDVPITEFALPGSDELALSCDPYLSKNALLLRNHGALSWDTTLYGALYKMETIEQTAKVTFLADMMNAPELDEEKVKKLLLLRK